MAGNKKATLKSLSDELAVVREELKEMHSLKEKVKELEKELMTLRKGEANHKGADEDIQTLQCRKCKRTFPSKKHLKEHIQVAHPKKLNCDHCEETFSSNYELETHAGEHNLSKNFRCEKCDKLFYLEWRLNKHKNVHHENTKICHYFSSRTRCPYEAVGCKFRHDDLSNKIDEVDEDDENESNTGEESQELHNQETIVNQEHAPSRFSATGLFANCAEHFPCSLCKFTSPSSAGLAEHVQRKHTQMQNQSFGFPISYHGMMPLQANGVSYAHCGRPGGQF